MEPPHAGVAATFDARFPKAGARTYLAVAGGIDVPLVLGSRSTYTLGALGGFHGRRLQAGDELPIGTASGQGRAGNSLPMALRRSVGGDGLDCGSDQLARYCDRHVHIGAGVLDGLK